MSGKGFNVFIDGKDEGKVPFDEAKTVELIEGDHQVYAKINWCSSKVFNINIKANETKEIELGLNNPPTKTQFFIAIIFAIIFIGGLSLGKLIQLELITDIAACSLYVYALYSLLILRNRSALYGITFGRKDYLYLKELGNQDS
jgi:hypothetical protein